MPIEKQLVTYNDKLERRSTSLVDMVVIHCTELPDEAMCRRYADKILYESGTGNCGHYYIFRDGRCVQYATVDRVAHHVMGHNKRSVGIELANRGRFPHWFHAACQEMKEGYTEQQYKALLGLLRALKQQLPALRKLVGHSDLDERWVPAEDDPEKRVRRKVDPGPQFDWSRVRRYWEVLSH